MADENRSFFGSWLRRNHDEAHHRRRVRRDLRLRRTCPGKRRGAPARPRPPASAWRFSTDTFVVTPHFFPGGNIGRLAVCGTVNDVATSGAR